MCMNGYRLCRSFARSLARCCCFVPVALFRPKSESCFFTSDSHIIRCEWVNKIRDSKWNWNLWNEIHGEWEKESKTKKFRMNLQNASFFCFTYTYTNTQTCINSILMEFITVQMNPLCCCCCCCRWWWWWWCRCCYRRRRRFSFIHFTLGNFLLCNVTAYIIICQFCTLNTDTGAHIHTNRKKERNNSFNGFK